MPLTKGVSKEIISRNIEELHSGKMHEKTEEKHGKMKADKQSIAIALELARRSKH